MKFLSAIRAWLVEDLGWKIFSVVLAIAVWLTAHRILHESAPVAGEGSPITYGNLPVTIVSAGTNVRGYQLLQGSVTVTVTGPAEAIGKLQANQIRATVDLTDLRNASGGKLHVDVSVPLGITVKLVKPDSIGIILPPAK